MYVAKHYSSVNDPAEFKSRMGLLAVELPRSRKEFNVDVWIVTGKSGIVAMAAMALIAPDEPFASIRKPDEDTNGGFIEGTEMARLATEGKQKIRYGIVDDFVSSGRTVQRVGRQLIDTGSDFELTCVVSYNTYNAEDKKRVRGLTEGSEHGYSPLDLRDYGGIPYITAGGKS